MKKILFIEDDQSLAGAYRAKLSPTYDTMGAVTGDSGIQKAQSWQPDFILLDLFLVGEKSGLDVLTELKSNEKTKYIPVMVLTNLENHCDECLKLGAVGCFLKTAVTMEEILTAIKKYLS